MGLRKGDRLMVIMPRLPQWWLLNIACARSGVVLMPGTSMLTSDDIQHRLLVSGAQGIITDAATTDKVDSVLSQCPNVRVKALVGPQRHRRDWLDFDELLNTAPSVHEAADTLADDPMLIFFTSGTTGKPKMALHSQASYGLGHTLTGKYWLDLTPQDTMWNVADTGWAKAAYCSVFAPWIQGSCTFVLHTEHKFDPTLVLRTLEKYPVSVYNCPPTGYAMCIQEKLTEYKMHSRLRHCCSAGEPLNPEVSMSWLRGTGLQVRQGYGQTETIQICASYRCLEDRLGSMGKPCPGVDMVVINKEGQELSAGQEGDVAVRVRPNPPFWLFKGYLDDPERTAAAFQSDYYLTGDRAYTDPDGYFWFVGRSDDVIISAGYRIGPFEVESALIEHPAVVESAVVSSPDPIRGEVVKAFVVLSPAYEDTHHTALIEEIQNHVKERTAAYKYPRKVEFVRQLPKTISGKIRRAQLRLQEWDRSA